MKQAQNTFPILSANESGFLNYEHGVIQKSIVGNSRVYQADCMDLLRQTPDKFYQLCIVDPPYGIGYDILQNKSAGTYRTQNGGTWKSYKVSDWDGAIPTEEYFAELKRVSVNQIIWGANFYPNNKPTKCWIIWDKIQRDDRADFEMAWTSFNKPSKSFSYSRADAYINDCDDKIHPCQKPVALYRWLLKNYAKPGDRILDTHLGSGSSRIAAHEMGFDFVGYELDKEYYDAAEARFQKYVKQEKLFTPEKLIQEQISLL